VRLLLIRHGIAVPSGTPGIADDDRPLTPRGRSRFRAAARGLARILDRPDLLLTSPLPRARCTADIAARAFGRLQPRPETVLAHGGAEAILALLARQPNDASVALVGHEPVLSLLLARLLGSGRGERFAFKKGGAALVDLPDGPGGGGRLVWFLKPRILRALGKI
jgi:phosphohistidine phosphatase